MKANWTIILIVGGLVAAYLFSTKKKAVAQQATPASPTASNTLLDYLGNILNSGIFGKSATPAGSTSTNVTVGEKAQGYVSQGAQIVSAVSGGLSSLSNLYKSFFGNTPATANAGAAASVPNSYFATGANYDGGNDFTTGSGGSYIATYGTGDFIASPIIDYNDNGLGATFGGYA